MNSSRIALLAAVAAAAGWTLKAVVIGLAGGLDRSPLEGPLFLAGLACFLVGTIALGVALAGDRGRGRRVLAGVVAVPVGFAVSSGLSWLVGLAQPAGSTHWVWSEVGLWAIALALVAAAAAWHARRAAPAPARR